jgi:hypothetical protein
MTGRHDFDFLHGEWIVHHRRLAERGRESSEWQEFEGMAETRPLLRGLCNIEEHVIAGEDFSGIALRTFDPNAQAWSIYWVSERDGILGAPVTGGFEGPLGTFDGDDEDKGRPVRVRFLWHRDNPGAPRWEQSFSYDEGRSWELNWTMDFGRADART